LQSVNFNDGHAKIIERTPIAARPLVGSGVL
jgi:hypothetical protein